MDASMLRIEKKLTSIAASFSKASTQSRDGSSYSGTQTASTSNTSNRRDAPVMLAEKPTTGAGSSILYDNCDLRQGTDRTLVALPTKDTDFSDESQSEPNGPDDKLIFKGPVVLVESNSGMVDPRSKLRLGWDLGVIVPLLFYFSVAMPYQVCFAAGTPSFEVGVDVLFLTDIVLNFRTGKFVAHPQSTSDDDKDFVEYDRWRVAKSYLSSWFLLDVASGIPFSLIELAASVNAGSEVSNLKLIKTLKLLRIMKFGRLLKLEKILRSLDRDMLDVIEDFFQHGFTRFAFNITYLAIALAYVCHVLCCGFVLVGRMGSLEGIPNWLEFEMKGPFEARDTVDGPSVKSIYIASFYYTLTTMTSVGYGDIITRNNSERIYTIFMEFLGAIVFAMIVAALSRVLTSMDVNTREKLQRLDAVSSFITLRGFPNELGRRIRRHFRHFYANKAAIDESRIFTELSTSLRKEVSQFIVPQLMGAGSFFTKMPKVLWPRLLPLLRPMRYEMGEQVCLQGEECGEMLVVLNGLFVGSTEVEGESFPRLRHIVSGSSINVLRVLSVWSQCVETVAAEHPSEVYELKAEEFTALFAGGADELAYEDLQRREVANFRMRLPNRRQKESANHPRSRRGGDDDDDGEGEGPEHDTPTKYGEPLYMSCFTTVELCLLKARDLITAQSAKRGSKNKSTTLFHHMSPGSRRRNTKLSGARSPPMLAAVISPDDKKGPPVAASRRPSFLEVGGSLMTLNTSANSSFGAEGEKWVVAELVSTATWKPYNNVWHHETARMPPPPPPFSSDNNSYDGGGGGNRDDTKEKGGGGGHNNSNNDNSSSNSSANSEPIWDEVVRWMDVTKPFETSAVRVRLFETDSRSRAVLLGQVHLKLVDLEDQYALNQPPLPGTALDDPGRCRCISVESVLTDCNNSVAKCYPVVEEQEEEDGDGGKKKKEEKKQSGGQEGGASNNDKGGGGGGALQGKSSLQPLLRDGEFQSWFSLDSSGDLTDGASGDPLLTSVWRRRWLPDDSVRLTREHVQAQAGDDGWKETCSEGPPISNTAVKLRVRVSRPECRRPKRMKKEKSLG